MSAESPRQLRLPLTDSAPNKRPHVSRTPESSDPRMLPPKDQLPLSNIDIPTEYRTSQYDLPEHRVSGEGIAVPLTSNNIFRDEETMNLSELGGTIQLIKTIYESPSDESSVVFDQERDTKTMERNVTMWGYAPTQETIVTLITTFDKEVAIRKNEREKHFASFLEKSKTTKPVAVYEFIGEELAAD